MKLYTIRTNKANVTSSGPLRSLATDLVVAGGTATYNDGYTYYYVYEHEITPEIEAAIEAVDDTLLFKFELTPTSTHRNLYVKVDSLEDTVNPSLPESTTTDEDGNETPITYAEVEARPTVSTPVREDGCRYYNATAHIGFRPLTADEAIEAIAILIPADELPALPESGDEI